MDKYSQIPPSLREHGSFCCWRYEEKNGRRTKIPINPTTGQLAQTNNPRTFVDFETARQIVSHYDGIGFLITDGLFVIDCDHCRLDDGSLTTTASEIADIFAGCYMEWSPSGQGLHVIGLAAGFSFDKKKYWMNNRNLNVEVYISGATNRFMTLTGDVFREGGLPDKTTVLQDFLERYMRRDSGVGVPIPVSQSSLDDDTVVAKATYARNGSTFKKLWSGDCSGYASQSEANLALAGILAFWCNRDISQMNRLFRQSGLFRDKWDRQQAGSTYGRITLEKAIGETHSTYRPPKSAAAPIQDGRRTLQNMRPEDNDRYCWADIGSGRLFADYFRDVARFVPER